MIYSMCSTFLDDPAFDFIQDKYQVLYLTIVPLFLNLLEIVKTYYYVNIVEKSLIHLYSSLHTF